MSKATDKMEKLANRFELQLRKQAEEPIIEDVYAFQKWLNENFTTVDKNKIASNIANTIEEDMNSLNVSLSVMGGKLVTSALVNGKEHAVAVKIVNDAVLPKISGVLAKFPNGSKYSGWIKFPK